MYPFTSRLISVTLLMMVLLLPSCSGPGNSGDSTGTFDVSLSGLIVADHVSVVDPQQTGGGSSKPSLLPRLLGAVQLSDLPPATDYRTDRVTVYVNERSLDSFRSVNEILCSIRQSRYDVMLNKGPYRALVDKNLCSADRSNASAAGQASTDQTGGSTMPMYEEWTVNSFRASAASPHIVQVWVHSVERNGDPPKLIHARLVITESADTAPPYGIFTANFKFFDPIADPGLTTVLAKGFLNAERVTTSATSTVLLHFATEDRDSYFIDKATLFKQPDGTAGAGSAFRAESYPGITPRATRFNMAYDAGRFLRTENSGTNICLDRNNFQESAWRYGLYTVPTDTSAAPGSRVNRNSNFQVKKQNGEYGSIGYWGAWFPNNGTVSDGEQVFKHDYSTNTDTAYTAFKRAGKLKKYTRDIIPLGYIKNIPLVLFVPGDAYLVYWHDTAGAFKITAQLGQNGSWIALPETDLDLSNLSWVDLMFWSQSLSGTVIVKLPPPTPAALPTECINNGNNTYDCTGKATSATSVVYFKETLVFPGDAVPSRLACFERCPDASALDTALPFHTDVSYQTVTPALATYTSYSFNSANMLLTESLTASLVTSTTATTPYENGITSGLLFDPTPANLDTLACPWNPGNTCAGQAWSTVPEFYVWETGPNSWNHFVTVRDGGGMPVKFDPPLQVKYLHSQPSATAPDAKYDGVTFFLQYQGFGDLQGIPGKCVNIDTGNDADCSLGGESIRWVPEFTIPSSTAGILTEVTDVARPAVTYVVKALEKEQRMSFLPVGACTGAGLTTSSYELPSMSSYVDPRIGPEPVVTRPPAVVGGVVQ